MALLEVDDLHVYYGNIHALKGVSLTVDQGEIVTLIGTNGAGKTTTLNTISGLLKPRQGTVRFDGQDLANGPSHHMVTLGVVQVPEGRRVFARLTVEENLRMGAFTINDKAAIDDGHRARLHHVPAPQGALEAGRGDAVGWRAADAGDGPRADGQAAPAAARRAVDGSGTHPRGVHLRDHRAASTRTARPILLVEQNALQALTVASRGYVLQTGAS